jgi:hypothetical protein
MKKGQRARQFNMMLVVMLFLLFTFGSQLEARVVPKIDCKKITLIQGKKKRLKVSGISAKKVRWVSKNNSIATVSRKGIVRAKKKGNTVIIAKAGKKKLRCKVNVQAKITNKKKKKHKKDLYDVADDKANAAIQELFGGHPEKYSEAERAYKVADWICSHVKYSTKDYYEKYNGDTYYVGAGNWETGLLKGTAKCSGFASLYVYMGWKVNLEFKPCLSAEANHAMNIVRIDGKYYWIDLTAHDGKPKLNGKVFRSKYDGDKKRLNTFSNMNLCTSRRFDDIHKQTSYKLSAYGKRIGFYNTGYQTVKVTKEEFDEEWDKAKPENKTINSAVHGDERCFFTGNDNEIYYYEHWDEIITDMYERGDYMNY